jgi:NADPH2:quinone reductase
VANDVANLSIGERVMTYAGHGCFAEEVVVSAHLVHKIPDEMTFEIAAGFVLAYGTAFHALVDRGKLGGGESLAVLGAAGGIGLCAIQIAKAIGARVIAVASSPEKLTVCRENGADYVLDTANENLRDRLREFSGSEGVHMVHDTVGGPLTLTSLRGLRPFGRHLIVGYSSGEIPQIPCNYILLKQVSVMGVSYRQCAQDSPELAITGMQALLAMWKEGKLFPHVSAVYPLERFGDALQALSSRFTIGKSLVRIAQI